MKELVLEYIKQNNLTNPGDTVICGLSGGADSCAMVSILHELSGELGINLVCAHLNHMLRDKEALRDMEFSKDFAKKLNIPFYSKEVNVSAIAKECGFSFEDAGRRARYDFFREVAKKYPSPKIATAHNRGDNAETLLMHIVSGSGIKGLKGIEPVQGNIIRPILCLNRKEIESYCLSKGINYVTDSTNSDVHYTRNFFRLEVLPLLSRINPFVEDALCRLTEIASDCDSFLEKSTPTEQISVFDNESSIPLSAISDMEDCLYPYLLDNMIKCAGLSCRLSKKTVSQIRSLIKSGKTIGNTQIGNGVSARISYDKLIISKHEEPAPYKHLLKYGKEFIIRGYKIYFSTIPVKDAISIGCSNSDTVHVRSKQNGDKIKIGGMTRKLQDMYVNKKIDRLQRSRLVVVSVNDIPVWGELSGLSDEAKSTTPSEKYIIIENLL